MPCRTSSTSELPNISEDYVHRIGRTGRAGMEGEALSLVCAEERGLPARHRKADQDGDRQGDGAWLEPLVTTESPRRSGEATTSARNRNVRDSARAATAEAEAAATGAGGTGSGQPNANRGGRPGGSKPQGGEQGDPPRNPASQRAAASLSLPSD